jgi:hypothetical protein
MRKIPIFLLLAAAVSPAFAKEAENVFFSEYGNQISLSAGHSAGAGSVLKLVPFNNWRSEPLEFASFQYSQPFEFFRLPARQNIHASFFWSHGSGTDGRTAPALGISWDAAALSWRGFYMGAGLGGFIKPNYKGRQDSLFMFGEKIFAGYRFSEKWSAEIYVQHFDNGGLTPENGGYTFYGLSALLNF